MEDTHHGIEPLEVLARHTRTCPPAVVVVASLAAVLLPWRGMVYLRLGREVKANPPRKFPPNYGPESPQRSETTNGPPEVIHIVIVRQISFLNISSPDLGGLRGRVRHAFQRETLATLTMGLPWSCVLLWSAVCAYNALAALSRPPCLALL